MVEYPAIATHDEKYRLKGEALHPERYGLKQLNSIKRAVGDRDWQALYQQSPVADDGAYYTTQMFPRYRLKDRPPLEDMAIFAVWDLAVGQKDYNDYTVGVVAGLDRNLDVWILDMVRDKLDGFGIVQSMIDVQKTWKPERQGVEKGQILMSIEVFLKLEIEKQNQWDLYYQPITPGKNDKEARGRGTQGLMRAQRIRFPDDDEAPWAAIMVHEMLRFPAGVHDDIPDAMGYIGYIYADMCPVPELEDERPPSWKDKLNKYVVGTEGKARRWQQA